MKLKQLTRNNTILLICLLAMLFLFPFFKPQQTLLVNLLQTAILFCGVFSLDFSSRSLKVLLPLGILTTGTTWITHFTHAPMLYIIDAAATFLFLVAIVVLLIQHIAKSRAVNATIILSAINGYLLLGLLGGALLALAASLDHILIAPSITAVDLPDPVGPELFNHLYLSFVTLTTLGYGDVTPASHLARSTAILLAISGQLYMTILIAMLVGKYLARAEEH